MTANTLPELARRATSAKDRAAWAQSVLDSTPESATDHARALAAHQARAAHKDLEDRQADLAAATVPQEKAS